MELICLAHSECLSISAGLPAPAEMVTNHTNMSVRSVHQIVFVHAKGKVKEKKKKHHLSNPQMTHSWVTMRECFVFGFWVFFVFLLLELYALSKASCSLHLEPAALVCGLQQIFASDQTFSAPALLFIELRQLCRKFGCLCATCKCNYFLLHRALWLTKVTLMQL